MLRQTRLSASLTAAIAAGAFGMLTSPEAMAQQLQRVEITGSAIKRVENEGALPVQTITRQEISRSGATSVEELLASIPSLSSAGGISNATGAGSSTGGVSLLSLRGLGSEKTLVLVNGRRIPGIAIGSTGDGAAANVNNIPLAAIERIEVLKDGASSIYGSDAVAGVVNFILSRNFQGIEVGAGFGSPTRSGGGQNRNASITAGFGNLDSDRFNITASATFEQDTVLFGRERTFAAKSDNFPFTVGAATGQGNIQGGWRATGGTVAPTAGDPWASFKLPGFAGGGPGASYGNPLAATGGCGTIRMFDAGSVSKINDTVPAGGTRIPAAAGAAQVGRFCQYDSGGDVGLLPDRESMNLTLNGAFRVSPALEAFGDVLYSQSTVTQTFQPSPVRNSFLQTIPDPYLTSGIAPALLINPANPNYATAATYLTNLAAAVGPDVRGAGGVSRRQEILNLIGQPLSITARVFDFGPRSSQDTTTMTRAVGGLRGELGAHSYEAAVFASESKLESETKSGYFSQSRYAQAVNASNEWNPWSLTQTAGFNNSIASSRYLGPILASKTRQVGSDARITGEALALPAGPLMYAAGLQYRQENYSLSPSAAYQSGDIAGLGGAIVPIDRDRKIGSAFGELNAPIIKGLESTLSLRQDRYNDVGNASTYKANVRWQPMPQLLVRGGVGTGFRAPTLYELWYPQTRGTSPQFNDPAFPEQAGAQTTQITGGNPNLKPEKSTQQSIGLVLQPIPQFTLSVDLWKVKVEDVIDQPSIQDVVSRFRTGDPSVAGLVTVDGANQIQLVQATRTNLASADVSGIDIEAAGRFNLGPGRVDVNLAGTYMIKYDQASPSGSVSQKVGTITEDQIVDGERVGVPVLGADNGGVILRWKHRLSATYSTGPWSFSLVQNYYQGYRTADRQYDGEKNFVPDQQLYDLNIGYTGVKNLRLAVGVKNLFDKDPPLFVPWSNQFQAGYDISTYDPRSRFVYVSANYRF
jgi:iron complex outermembrane recepter protein